MDQLLGGLFGGQDDEDVDARTRRAKDYVNRYETGAPHEGLGDDEVLHNYRSVSSRVSPQDYEESAVEAFGRMSKEERRELKKMMRERSGGRFDYDGDDPRGLARATSRYEQLDQGGGLASLFGGGGSQSSAQGGGVGSLLSNPIAKAALGGVAAIAMKKMMDRR